MPGNIKAMVSCQNEMCAAEVSYSLDMVRMLDGQPICHDCYIDGDYGEHDEDGCQIVDWHDLPAVELTDLSD